MKQDVLNLKIPTDSLIDGNRFERVWDNVNILKFSLCVNTINIKIFFKYTCRAQLVKQL